MTHCKTTTTPSGSRTCGIMAHGNMPKWEWDEIGPAWWKIPFHSINQISLVEWNTAYFTIELSQRI